jgi:hypothetical protein
MRREALAREHAFHAVKVAQQAGPTERTDDLAAGLRRREVEDVSGAGQPEPVVEEERDGEAVDVRAELERRRGEERRERGAARGRGGGAGLRLLGLAGRGEAEDDGGLGRSKGDVREFALVVRAGEPERRVAERIEQCGEQRGRDRVALVDGGATWIGGAGALNTSWCSGNGLSIRERRMRREETAVGGGGDIHSQPRRRAYKAWTQR